MNKKQSENEMNKEGAKVYDTEYLQHEKLLVHQYILKYMQSSYCMLFEVHMDTWIVDMLDLAEEYQAYFEPSMYYARFIEIMEEEIVHPEEEILVGDLFSMSHIMHEITEKKEPYEFRLRCKYQNTYKWFQFQFSYMPVANGAGKLIVLQKDIDKKVSKETRQKRQQSVVNMLSNRYGVVGLINLKNNTYEMIRMLPYVEVFTNYTNYEDVLRSYLEERVVGKDADNVFALLHRDNLLEHFLEKKHSIEYIYQDKQGQYVKTYVIATSYFSKETPDVIVSFENITGIMRDKERQLAYYIREQFMMNIIQNDYIFMIVVDMKTGIYQFHEFSNGEKQKVISGRHFDEIAKDQQIRRWKEAVGQIAGKVNCYQLLLASEDKGQSIEKLVYQVKTEYKHMWLESKVYFFHDEEQTACILTRDISNEVQTQNLIKAQNDILRTALQETKAISEAKGSFLSNMSHDIRTPMNAVMGMTNVALKNYQKPEKVKTCLENIMQSAQHMMNIVNNILDMSQITNGELELHQEEYRISVLLHDIEKVMQKLCDDKKLTLQFHKTGILHDIVKMDAGRMRQVLLNIAVNAIEFTPEGGKILFDVTEQKGLGFRSAQYVFCIQDTGIGISEEFQKQIFKPFEQEMNMLFDRNEGAGLGLTISKYIIDKMGGTISIDSALGEGTSVYVSVKLPLGKNAEQGNANPNETMKKTYPGKRILLVEDKKMNIEIMKELLNGTMIAIEEVYNGQEAVEIVQKMPERYYDLIFMDIRMPILKGDEATMKIRNIKRKDCKTVPIIAMTANVLAEDVKRAMQAGMNEYLTKPIEIESMFNILDKYLVEE